MPCWSWTPRWPCSPAGTRYRTRRPCWRACATCSVRPARPGCWSSTCRTTAPPAAPTSRARPAGRSIRRSPPPAASPCSASAPTTASRARPWRTCSTGPACAAWQWLACCPRCASARPAAPPWPAGSAWCWSATARDLRPRRHPRGGRQAGRGARPRRPSGAVGRDRPPLPARQTSPVTRVGHRPRPGHGARPVRLPAGPCVSRGPGVA